jgi:two-component system LytT family response regulator
MSTTPVTCIVVDDEPLARRKLRELMRGTPWLTCIAEADDGREALRAIDEQQPHLVFLDVRMPGMSGIDVARRAQHTPAIIFTTAYDRYAVTAFELAAIDYLLKPFSRERFEQALERARHTLEARLPTTTVQRLPELSGAPATVDRIFVRDGGRIVPLRVRAVQHFEACDDFIYVHAAGRRYRLNVSLNAIADKLDARLFVRVHRSYIVNLDGVTGWTPYDAARFELTLRDGTTLIASREGSRVLRTLVR